MKYFLSVCFLVVSSICLELVAETVSKKSIYGFSERTFNIHQQALAGALLDFSKQAKVQILFDADTMGKHHILQEPITGKHSLHAALNLLLDASRYRYTFIAHNIIVVTNVSKKVPPKHKKPLDEELLSLGYEQKHALNRFSQAFAKDNTLFPPQIASSNALNVLGEENIKRYVVTNTADILRRLPGIWSEASSGEGGNSLVALRGLPISLGGARYVQFQEDGFPILQFSDLAFASSLSFLRYDKSVKNVNAIRGGNAATLVSNAPGAVINLQSKTGEKDETLVSTTLGLDYETLRTDFSLGKKINESLSYHIGGFFRYGDTPQFNGYNANNGGQIKANITEHFKDGYTRFYVKYLNDQAITYYPSPLFADGSQLPNYDQRNSSEHSRFLRTSSSLTKNNIVRELDVTKGAHQKVNFWGNETAFDISDFWTLNNRFAFSKITGGVVSPFVAAVGGGAEVADFVTNLLGGDTTLAPSLRYANGPLAGQLFDMNSVNSNGLVSMVHLFDIDIEALDSYSNDLRLSYARDDYNITFGVYRAQQTVATTLQMNSYLSEVKGRDAALLNLIDGSGKRLSDQGIYAYGSPPLWGHCCQRHYDASYSILAPYVSALFDMDKWHFDISFRRDSGSVNGEYINSSSVPTAVDINGDGQLQAPEQAVRLFDNTSSELDFDDWHYVSKSLGIQLDLSRTSSLFARWNYGAANGIDRSVFSGLNGSDSKSDLINSVKSYEFGYRRTGKYSVFSALLFRTDAFEDQLVQANSNIDLGLAETKTDGIELEGVFSWRRFTVDGTFTLNDSEVIQNTFNPDFIGNRPRYIPRYLFTTGLTYNMGDTALSLDIVGAGRAYTQENNMLSTPSFVQVNTSANVDLSNNLSLAINVHNVFNEIILTEVQESEAFLINAPGSITDGQSVITGRVQSGRSSTLTLQYTF